MTIQITPEAVKAAYEKTGLTPRQVWFYDEKENCACALSALAIAHGGRNEYKAREKGGIVNYFSELTRLNNDQLWAFISGFDACSTNLYGHDEFFKLGEQVRDLLFPEVTQ